MIVHRKVGVKPLVPAGAALPEGHCLPVSGSGERPHTTGRACFRVRQAADHGLTARCTSLMKGKAATPGYSFERVHLCQRIVGGCRQRQATGASACPVACPWRAGLRRIRSCAQPILSRAAVAADAKALRIAMLLIVAYQGARPSLHAHPAAAGRGRRGSMPRAVRVRWVEGRHRCVRAAHILFGIEMRTRRPRDKRA